MKAFGLKIVREKPIQREYLLCINFDIVVAMAVVEAARYLRNFPDFGQG